MMKKLLALVTVLLFVASCASTHEKLGHEISYQNKDTTMNGYIASDSDGDTKKPGILVVHEWWGHNEYARKRADMLAKEGYVALAVDMYGGGKQAEHPKEAQKFSSQVFSNLDSAKNRFLAAMETLKSHPHVDKNKIAAIGYCFGGGVVLTMARMGLPLEGVVSYHGSLASPVKAKKGQVKADVLVFHGGKDPLVSERDVKNFKKEMKRANVDLDFNVYEDAKHAFTNPKATKLGQKFGLPLAYNKEADKDSWQKTLKFFDDIF